MHRIYYGMAPSYLCKFIKVDIVHTYGTRHCFMSYVLPVIKSQGKKSFMYNGARLWNGLPVSIRSIDNKENFKKKCKIYFFKEMENTENSEYTQ